MCDLTNQCVLIANDMCGQWPMTMTNNRWRMPTLYAVCGQCQQPWRPYYCVINQCVYWPYWPMAMAAVCVTVTQPVTIDQWPWPPLTGRTINNGQYDQWPTSNHGQWPNDNGMANVCQYCDRDLPMTQANQRRLTVCVLTHWPIDKRIDQWPTNGQWL